MQYAADRDQHERQEKHGKRRALIPRIAVLRHALQLVLTDPVHPVHFRADALLELLVVPLLFLGIAQMILHRQAHPVNIFLLLPDPSAAQLLDLTLSLDLFLKAHDLADARILHCDIRVIRLHIRDPDPRAGLPDLRLIFRSLRRLYARR